MGNQACRYLEVFEKVSVHLFCRFFISSVPIFQVEPSRSQDIRKSAPILGSSTIEFVLILVSAKTDVTFLNSQWYLFFLF